MKQLRRGVDFGDCFKGIEAIKMGKAWWLHSGRNGQGRLFTFFCLYWVETGAGTGGGLSHDPQDPSPGSTKQYHCLETKCLSTCTVEALPSQTIRRDILH